MLMTLLSLLPAILLAMTSFTRVVVVLAILRQALGNGANTSNQIIIGLALFLSLFIMAPVLERAYEDGLRPYLDEKKLNSMRRCSRSRRPFANLC